MSAAALLQAWLRMAKRRRIAIVSLLALPWLLVALVLALRCGGGFAYVLVAVAAALTVAWAHHGVRGIHGAWLARRLDALRRDLEDSAALLFAKVASLSPLARLQRARMEQRLLTTPHTDVRPPWPLRQLFWNAAFAVAVGLIIALWPASPPSSTKAIVPARDDDAAVNVATRITSQQVEVIPPAYTGLPARREDALSLRVPETSTLRWTLRFSPQPGNAELVFHDGSRLSLQRKGEDWTASRIIRKAALYRLQLSDAPPMAKQELQRIDVQADRPPQLRIIAPDRSLSLLENGQKQWPIFFEASDDYGLGAAQLHITLAQGSGENISVSERTLALRGDGNVDRSGRHRSYRHALDLSSSGFAAGDDLIVRFSVSDNRAPQPQATRSASFILRWPPSASVDGSGLEGMMKKVLPAYLRSQRQIIIDSEALLKQRGKLARNVYVDRSDAAGVDQRILRLRYGQFLGEEADEGPKSPTGNGDNHADENGHDHGDVAKPAALSDANSLLEAYGHTHDIAEAATLLDPETRVLLKKALDQMWQSELHLRQGYPDKALLYEYRALGFIKQVQQASRIYLARVGLELPPIDEGRRLGGDRKGLQSRGDMLVAATEATTAVDALWRKLDTTKRIDAGDLDAFEGWLRRHEADVPDALSLYAASDALRAEPGCVSCARKLRALLWPLLATPATATQSRDENDRAGRAYLDALREERKP